MAHQQFVFQEYLTKTINSMTSSTACCFPHIFFESLLSMETANYLQLVQWTTNEASVNLQHALIIMVSNINPTMLLWDY